MLSLNIILLTGHVFGATLMGSPQPVHVMEDKVKPYSANAQNVPDGKMWMMRKDLNDKGAGFLIETTPNNFLNSTSSSLNDVVTVAGEDTSAYPIIPNDVPIPPASETGLRGNGSNYDEGSWWIFCAFRLSETSQPGTDTNKLIGFEHNEDYYQNTDGPTVCTHKSIGIRYSDDLGKTWTRSVPIITKDRQNETCSTDRPFTGTGDFTAMWTSDVKKWVIFAQEGIMVMSESPDPLAGPGTWSRIDPKSGKTAPGYIADPEPLAHGDLAAISGASPSIIRDEKNGVWHMIYNVWDGGLVYTKSQDLYRWDTPAIILASDDQTSPNAVYSTIVGDEGDTLTTDGIAIIYYGASNQVDWGRALWSVGIDFGSGGTSNTSLPSSIGHTGNTTSISSAPVQPAPAPAPATSRKKKHRKHRKHPVDTE